MTTHKKPILIYIGNCLSQHGNTPSYMEILGPRLEAEGYKLFYASGKRNQFIRFIEMAYVVLSKRHSADYVLIDTYSTKAFYYAWGISRLCRYLGKQYIPILHGGNLPKRMKTHPKLCAQLFNQGVINIVISDYLRKSVEEKGYRYELIPNAIDINNYTFLKRTEIHRPKLLWVRAFHDTYNPEMAVQVLKKLLITYPDATMTMVGPEKDGSMERCIIIAKEAGISNKIKFTGKLLKQEWISLSEEHNLFINTTNYDNLPVSVIEAMALGMPVVSTDVGGISYLIDNGNNGLLVNKADIDGMVDSVRKLITNDGLVGRLSIGGRTKAEEFSWSHIKDKWNDLFLHLKTYA